MSLIRPTYTPTTARCTISATSYGESHQRGIRVITELMINHTSDEHPWVSASRRSKPNSRWRNFYVRSETPQRYTEARYIFRNFKSSNWTWD